MKGFSKVIIVGNLTRDPELRTTPNGATVCNFSVAVNRTYRDVSGNRQEDVSYIDCVAWSKAGEIIHQYVHKGSPLLISGRLDQRSWIDKSTEQRRSRVEVVVEDFTLISGRGRAEAEPAVDDEYERIPNSGPASADGAEIIPNDISDSIDLDKVPF